MNPVFGARRDMGLTLESIDRGEGLERQSIAPTGHQQAGAGYLELSRVAGRTVLTRARANSPLKLLSPRSPGNSAWIFASTFGGGLVAGDHLRLQARLGPSTTCLLSTQASTKVYRSRDGLGCRQTLDVTVGEEAVCVAMPHPVTCFAQARFVQRQRFDLAPGATLVAVDWLTNGRHAIGERWAFDVYDSRTDVFQGGRRLFRDALRLCGDDGPIAAPHRTGGFDCFACALVIGDRLRCESERILADLARVPISFTGAEPLLFSASPLENGLVLRVAGRQAQEVARWLREQLAFVPQLLREDPWARLG